MELDRLRTFLAVLEHGSFARAGQALGVGQSTVSFHVKALERSVGATLLERGRGGGAGGRRAKVLPTEAGRVLRPYAERILAARDEALARLRAGEEGELGLLTIAASTIPGEHLLPALLARLRALHPGIRVELEISDSEKATAAVLAREADLAVVGSKPRERRLVALVLAHDEVVLVGPVPNPFAPRGRLEPEELRDVPLILREPGSGTRHAIASLLPHALAGEHGAAVRVGSSEAAKRCVEHGLGLSFLSRQAVAGELAAGRLAIVELAGTPVRRTFYVVRHRAVTPSAAARAFLELVDRGSRSERASTSSGSKS